MESPFDLSDSQPHDPLAWLDCIPDTALTDHLEHLISPDSSESAPPALSPFSGSLTPLLPTSSQSEPENDGSNDDGYATASSSTSGSSSASRPTKKARVTLNPSQPLTAKGKPRARVYLACHECRSRKIRCDGAKPVCYNCQRRDASLEQCTYDSAPKRRGQDKVPGSRARNSAGKRTIDPGSQGDQDASHSPLSHSGSQASTKPHFESVLRGFDPASFNPEDIESYLLPPLLPNLPSPSQHDPECEPHEEATQAIASTPSIQFTRETWWDALLAIYADDRKGVEIAPTSLSAEQRLTSTQAIFADIRALLHSSLYWASFLHLPRFFETILDPARRQTIQPCLMMSMLAVGAFVESSRRHGTARLKKRALKLMDHAHSAIQASLASNWVDVGLAQAAWFMAYFELHGNDSHKTDRTNSAMSLLDSFIRLLLLTKLDVDQPNAQYSIFAYSQCGTQPRSSQSPFVDIAPSCAVNPHFGPPTGAATVPAPIASDLASNVGTGDCSAPASSTCGCEKYTLKQQWPTVSLVAPLWQATAMWPQGEALAESEVRKEEGRRLVWSSVMLSAACGGTAFGIDGDAHRFNLYVEDYQNLVVLFPGAAHRDAGQRDSVWNLCIRAMVLWHASLRVRHDALLGPQERAEFATRAWLEADAIEAALNAHSCGLEAGNLYQAREYLFNSRMCMSHEFQLFAPHVTTVGVMSVYREKAESWLRDQMWVCEWIWQSLKDPNNVLANRPLLSYWFMSHVNRALTIYKYDPTLIIALEAAKAFTRPLEYSMRIWPSDIIRKKWEGIRFRLVETCLQAGVDPPSCSFAFSSLDIPPSRAKQVPDVLAQEDVWQGSIVVQGSV